MGKGVHREIKIVKKSLRDGVKTSFDLLINLKDFLFVVNRLLEQSNISNLIKFVIIIIFSPLFLLYPMYKNQSKLSNITMFNCTCVIRVKLKDL